MHEIIFFSCLRDEYLCYVSVLCVYFFLQYSFVLLLKWTLKNIWHMIIFFNIFLFFNFCCCCCLFLFIFQQQLKNNYAKIFMLSLFYMGVASFVLTSCFFIFRHTLHKHKYFFCCCCIYVFGASYELEGQLVAQQILGLMREIF